MAKSKPDKKQIVILDFKSNADITQAIKDLTDLQRKIDAITDEKNAQIAVLSKELQEETTPLQIELDKLRTSIKYYCDNNRERLFSDKQKSVDFVSGSVAYRDNPPSVKSKLTKTLLEKLIGDPDSKLAKGLERLRILLSLVYIRISLELDKQSALKNIDKAKELGIEFEEDGENFYINPFEYDGEFKV
jgi:phage host-nuclease inhibitor protein Gam